MQIDDKSIHEHRMKVLHMFNAYICMYKKAIKKTEYGNSHLSHVHSHVFFSGQEPRFFREMLICSVKA